jgi:hypothetical protein
MAWVLAMALGFLLVAEGVARYLVVLGRAEQSHTREFDGKYHLASQPNKNPQGSVVMLGNSLMARAAYAELLEARLQEANLSIDVRNLAAGGNTPGMNLFLLKRAVESGVQPRLVILNVAPFIFNDHYVNNRQSTPEGLFRKSYLGRCFYQVPTTWEGQAECALGKGSYLVRYRDFIKSQLVGLPGTVANPKKGMKFKPVKYPKGEVSPKGWSPAYEVYTHEQYVDKFSMNSDYQKLNMQVADRFLANYAWTAEPVQAFQRYCEEQGIPLLLVWFPEHPVWKDYYTHYGLEQEAFLPRFQALATPPHSYFVDLHDRDPDGSHYYNPDHQNALGAFKTTTLLSHFLLEEPLRSLLPSGGDAVQAPAAAESEMLEGED